MQSRLNEESAPRRVRDQRTQPVVEHDQTSARTSRTRAQELFQTAFELEPARRAELLDRACADDTALRAEVESLLAAHDRAGSFLEAPLAEAVASIWIGRRIGNYEILSLLGRGGMGLVFEARQDHPHRTVALKLLRPDLADESVARRFEIEAELLGRLQHIGIAQVFEAGTVETELGRQPFLAMELIDGRPLVRYAEEERLDQDRQVELVALVCDAVDHAHQRDVIHRDLKPSNVLVDSSGQPKVLDFGVARAIGSDLEPMTLLTRAGQLVGTVGYMSPEQATGDPATTRSDVYALGVLLYELITGHLPHDIRDLPLHEALRVVREEAPSEFPRGDLGTILEMALAPEPERRYGTARELADDLRRCLRGEPIHARPPSTIYHLRTFAQRHAGLVGGFAGVVLLLVAGIILAVLGANRERVLREEAEEATDVAERARERSERDLYLANLNASEAALRSGDVDDARMHLEATRSPRVGWEWTHLNLRLDHSEALWKNEAGMCSAALSADGTQVATGGLDGRVRLWDRSTGALLWRRVLRSGLGVRGLAFDPKGERMAASGGYWVAFRTNSGPIQILDTSTGKPLGTPLLGHRDATQCLVFHPRLPLLISGSSDRTVRVWNLDTHQQVHVFDDHENEVRELAFSPDGTELASVAWDGTVRIRDADTFELRSVLHSDVPVLNALAWSPDGLTLAVGTRSGEIQLFDRASGERTRTLRGHVSRITGIAFTPDGSRLHSSCFDKTLRAWDPHTGRELGVFLGSGGPVQDLLIEPGGETLLSFGNDEMVRRWAIDTQDVRTQHQYANIVYTNDVSPDGRILATASGGYSQGQRYAPTNGHSFIRLNDMQSGRDLGLLIGHGTKIIWSVDFAPDSRRLVSAGNDKQAIVWDVELGEQLVVLEHPDEVRDAVFSLQGEHIATVCRDGVVRIWEAASGVLERELSTGNRRAVRAHFDPSGTWLVVLYRRGHVARWDWENGVLARMLESVHTEEVTAAAFDPSGTVMVTSSLDQTIQRWDAGSFTPVGLPLLHSAPVLDLAFSPDGLRLAAADHDVLRLWDTTNWVEVANLRGHADRQKCVSFSPDGRFLITGGADRLVRIWDGGTQAQRLVDRWMGELLLSDDVIARVREEPGLSKELREEALTLATARQESVTDLNNAAWRIASSPGLEPDEYALALRRARAAAARAPEDGNVLNTLGAALYRTQNMDEALEVLRTADELQGGVPLDAAFLALVQGARGQREQAEKEWKRLEAMISEERWSADAEVLALVSEVRVALGLEDSIEQ